jgi:hypothetical protein
MPDDQEFARTVAAAAAGDAAAWEAIITVEGPLVQAYLRAVDHPDPAAELGQVFDEAARGVDCFEGDPAELRAYLFDVAVARRRAAALAPAAAPALPELAVLHPDVRDALLLARIADLAPAAIADILEVPTSTILEWQHQGASILNR